MPDNTPMPYQYELQYVPAALVWKLERLFKRIRQGTGYAKLNLEIADNAVKRFGCEEQFHMPKVEEEYQAALSGGGKAA